jgi:hypothetical protein
VRKRTRGLAIGSVVAATLGMPAAASAWTVEVHIHGAGGVEEVLNRLEEDRNQMACDVSPLGRSETSPPVTCTGGTANGLWNSGNVVRLAPRVATEAFNRGWRFDHWTDSNAGGGQINCDPQDKAGEFSTPTYCEFAIFQNLETNLYFDDTFGPNNTSITGGPPDTTASSTAAFNFNASDDPDATFECKLDRPGITGLYTACGGPSDKGESYSNLTDGTYTFTVRGRDPSGNPDHSPASQSFTVDRTAPDTVIDTGPQGPTADATPTFTFHSTEPSSSLACFLDGSPVACTGGTFTPQDDLADGPREFSVLATDAVGNSDSSAAIRSFSVDTTGPEITVTDRPKARVRLKGRRRTARVTFGFTADDAAAEFTCSLDGETFAPCSSPQTYKVRRGTHVFRVNATDALGNAGNQQTLAFKVLKARR